MVRLKGRPSGIAGPTGHSSLKESVRQDIRKNVGGFPRTVHVRYLTGKSRILAPIACWRTFTILTSTILPSSAAARTM